MKIESHLILILQSPPQKSDWELWLLNIASLSPYYKLSLPHRPDFIETTKYVIERIGGELNPKTVFEWMKIAIVTGDCESLCLCPEQAGSKQFLYRTQPSHRKEGEFLEKSALELSIIIDRKAIFNILISKGSPIQME
jgi:hypothetical protein